MGTAIVVLRATVLFHVFLLLIMWLFVNHTTRLTADAAALAAADAAARAIPADWACDTAHASLSEAQFRAFQAVRARTSQGGARATAVTVTATECQIAARVTVAGLSARWAGLEHTSVACSTPRSGIPVTIPAGC